MDGLRVFENSVLRGVPELKREEKEGRGLMF
jgi:hypothetical protein